MVESDDDWMPVFTIGFFPDGEHGGVALLQGARYFREIGAMDDAIDAAIELLHQIRGREPGTHPGNRTLN